MSTSKLNERAWTGHVISWIKEAIARGQTTFEEATNDEGLKVESGKMKFPDILLFSNKVKLLTTRAKTSETSF